MILLLSTSDTDLLSARASGADYRWANPARLIPEEDLAVLYGCADVFAMCCRDRWAGLEAEGFGIVFVEAAACGVQINRLGLALGFACHLG